MIESDTDLEAKGTTPDFAAFVACVAPYVSMDAFHRNYYGVLGRFACGEIRRLIVTIPPQHGKSLGASVLLPAYILGCDPDVRIALASYSASLACKFNRQVQRVIDSEAYLSVFPGTTIKGRTARGGGEVRRSDEFEIIGRSGSLISVGRQGALTGNPVDIFILDDLYKDAMEGNSPVVRDNTWEWYNAVVKTRLHNFSRELIVFTRWHRDDLIGRIEKSEPVADIVSLSQEFDPGMWYRLNFEAVKESPPTDIDPRGQGEVLWPQRQDACLLAGKRRLDPVIFECMYQGHPSTEQGLLYGDRFATYSVLPEAVVKLANYTDTADTGDDYLCSVCYAVGADERIYITDVVLSREPMEVTEGAVASMLRRNDSRVAYIESNNGGRGFARALERSGLVTRVEWFNQSSNKEARILSNSATVLKYLVMPDDWKLRWGDFYRLATTYGRRYASNRWHDVADVLTGIVEREVLQQGRGRVRAVSFRK